MPTLHDGLPIDEWVRERYKERKRAETRVEKHQPKVIDIHHNGEFVDVEWTRSNGERVSGTFELKGWRAAPADVVADTMKRLSNPPVFVTGTRGPGGGAK